MTHPSEWRRALWHLRTSGLGGYRAYRRRMRHEALDPSPRSHLFQSSDGTLSFVEWPLPDRLPARADLRVAVILDDFSRLALGYEWHQIAVTPDTWRQVLVEDPVDLLVVESAWHGNGDAWQYHLTGPSAPREAFVELVAWCRENGIPTVFWNKEDPAHYDDFLDSARLFDHVFTTDVNLLEDYRRDLGHDRVAVLPFAAQPAIHNPVRPRYGHQARDVAFAGMYFAHKYPERREQMDLLLGAAHAVSPRMEHGLEIFSRYLGADEKYQFPAPLSEHVVGSLNYQQMLSAYRAYKVFLNVNSVVTSPSMCARRIFEISASGTPVVSTPSEAIAEFFPPDEVLQVGESAEAEHALRALVGSPELRDRIVHRAQRRIWSHHTYGHRVDDVLSRVGLDDHLVTERRPSVSVIVSSIRPENTGHVIRTVAAQQGVDVQLVYLAHGWEIDEAAVRRDAAQEGLGEIVVLRAGRDRSLGGCLNLLVDAADGELVAKLDDDDLYGADYLHDQVRSLEYSGADVVGKRAHHVYLEGMDVTALRFPEHEHRHVDLVMGPTLVTGRDLLLAAPFPDLTVGEDTGFLRQIVADGGSIYASDRFGFVQMRKGAGHTWDASDMEILASAVVLGDRSVIESVFV